MKNSKDIKFIELFAGIGGFRYGLERVCTEDEKQGFQGTRDTKGQYEQLNNRGSNRFTCVYANEWDKYASQIYKKHYGEIDTRDITTVKAEEIPHHDLLVGGFPCQAFSVAGKRQGFEDTRGTLFFEIARILQQKQPRLLLLENVKGLLSHDKGKTFGTILNTLDELGYDCQWQVLNSKDFGVPQNRERVFIVGNLRGTRRPEVFPIGGTNKQTLEYVTGGGLDKWLDDGKNLSRNHSQGQRVYSPLGLATTQSSQGGGWGAKTGLYAINTRPPRTELHYEKSPTLTQSMSKEMIKVNSDFGIRRLTPKECARLQGFPDDWCEGLSDTQQYKCYGNAVTTNVITAIGERLV